MHNKIYFKYSGPTPLENDDELDIIDEMIDDGPKLHEYLPVLYALGISALLPRVTPAQREEISYALSDPKDKRQAQILIQYINVFKACLAAIEEFGLEAPPLFTSGEIDMTSLIYFNHPPEVNISPALMTRVCQRGTFCLFTVTFLSLRIYSNMTATLVPLLITIELINIIICG